MPSTKIILIILLLEKLKKYTKAYREKIMEIEIFFTVFVLVGTCNHLNTTLMAFVLLNYQPPHYPRPHNKLDSITQKITGCDWHLISPYSITLESNVWVTRIKEIIKKLKVSEFPMSHFIYFLIFNIQNITLTYRWQMLIQVGQCVT